MGKEGQKDTEKILDEQLKLEEAVKSTIFYDVTGATHCFASVFSAQRSEEFQNTEIFEKLNGSDGDTQLEDHDTDDMEEAPLFNQATDASGQKSPKRFDVLETKRVITKVMDEDLFKEYKSYIPKIADEMDEFLESSLTNDEPGREAKEFVKSYTSDKLRRINNGFSNVYLGYKNLMCGGMDAMYACINSTYIDGGLQKNMMSTMSDYYTEKEKNGGALSPEREHIYRQKIYDQTVSMSAMYNKMMSSLENP